jgi:iron-sulfur cluster repair protein YtfE (RIC family)
MATIGNMPGADVQVEFPSGVRTVNMIRLLVHAQNAEFKRDHGMFLPGVNKLNPTVKSMREEYEIPEEMCRTWEQLATILRKFHTDLTNAIKEFNASIPV